MDSPSEGRQHRRTLLGRVVLDSGVRALLGIYDDLDCRNSVDPIKVEDGKPYFTRYDHSRIGITARERRKPGHNYRYWEFVQTSPRQPLPPKPKSGHYQKTI